MSQANGRREFAMRVDGAAHAQRDQRRLLWLTGSDWLLLAIGALLAWLLVFAL